MRKRLALQKAVEALHPLVVTSGIIILVSGLMAGTMFWIALGDSVLFAELDELFLDFMG